MSVTSRMAEGSFLVEARDMERLEDVVVMVICKEATEDLEAECGVDRGAANFFCLVSKFLGPKVYYRVRRIIVLATLVF